MSVEVPIRVRYAETDRMGVVYHANYVVWFEVGRTELCRRAGVVYRELEAAGWLLVVGEVSARFHAPADYDDELVVRAKLSQLGSRGLRFDYEVVRSGTRLASGFTSHVFCDATTRKPVRAPEWALGKFRAVLERD